MIDHRLLLNLSKNELPFHYSRELRVTVLAKPDKILHGVQNCSGYFEEITRNAFSH